MKYVIALWGTDCDSVKVFCRQKKVFRLIAGVKKCESCRQIFKDFKMLTMPSVCILDVYK
jgi:ribosomal protein L37AE/L43A